MSTFLNLEDIVRRASWQPVEAAQHQVVVVTNVSPSVGVHCPFQLPQVDASSPKGSSTQVALIRNRSDSLATYVLV